jgi:8-oxo-dGTP diphosphatase
LGRSGEPAAQGEGRAVALDAEKERRRYPERPIIGVLAVVVRDRKALIVRRSNPPMAGRWGFPGGVLELGETVAEGAMRELREETGIVAEPAGILTVLDSIQREDDGRVRYHYALVAVRGVWRAGEGMAGDDADEVAWLSRADIFAQDLPVAPALLAVFDLALAEMS